MIRPEASPLFDPVQIVIPPHGCPDDVIDELWAWLRSHNVHPYPGGWLHRVVVDQHRLTLTTTDPPALPGFTLTVPTPTAAAHVGSQPEHPAPQRKPDVLATRPLLSHPALRMLVVLARTGNLFCTATRDRDECNVRVDSRGRHPGSHADGRYGDGVWWPNDNEGTAEIPVVTTSPASADNKVHVREPFADFLDRLLVDNARAGAGIVSAAPASTPARPITKADIDAAITRLTRQSRLQVWRYTPPEPAPALGAVPMIIAFDPAYPQRVDVWQLDTTTGTYHHLRGEAHATN